MWTIVFSTWFLCVRQGWQNIHYILSISSLKGALENYSVRLENRKRMVCSSCILSFTFDHDQWCGKKLNPNLCVRSRWFALISPNSKLHEKSWYVCTQIIQVGRSSSGKGRIPWPMKCVSSEEHGRFQKLLLAHTNVPCCFPILIAESPFG